jgi:glycosyltransferase involved in cell wall biosynthesis
MPKISIILPVFNSKKTITKCLKSILTQSFTDYELLIFDAYSTDGTIELINKIVNGKENVRFYIEKDKGVYDAMNKGIEISCGDWLYFIGSDDFLFSRHTLSEVVSQFEPNIDFLYGNVKLRQSKRIYSGESNFNRLIRDAVSICHQAIFYRRRLFKDIGCYDLKYPIHADYDFNVRCFINQEVSKKYVNLIICYFNETGLSGQKSKLDFFHTDLKNIYNDKYLLKKDLYEDYLLLLANYNKIIDNKMYPIYFRINKLLKKIYKTYKSLF